MNQIGLETSLRPSTCCHQIIHSNFCATFRRFRHSDYGTL